MNRIIIGTMNWGKWGKNLSIKEMSDKIKFCHDHALNTFDHADIYVAIQQKLSLEKL